MSTVNRIILVGHLGKDPERFEYKSKGETQVGVRLRLATNDRKDQPSWHTIMAFGNLADQCLKFLSKGRMIYTEGTLQYKKVEGTNYHDARVIAEKVEFLGGRGESVDKATANTSHQYSNTKDDMVVNSTLSTLVESYNVKE